MMSGVGGLPINWKQRPQNVHQNLPANQQHWTKHRSTAPASGALELVASSTAAAHGAHPSGPAQRRGARRRNPPRQVRAPAGEWRGGWRGVRLWRRVW